MNSLRNATDRIKTEYESAVRSCSWDDDVASVLKQKIYTIIIDMYSETRRAVDPISQNPVESGEVTSHDISNLSSVLQRVCEISSKLKYEEQELSNFKI